MPYFRYKSKNVYYVEFGDGQPLLFLHGNTASSNMFLNIVQEYTSQFKVVLIDFLGYGKSDRVESFPTDLWFDEAQQVISFLDEKSYKDALLIGSSGGALVAINVALERPELVNKVVADSFEGVCASASVTEGLAFGREQSKQNPGAVMFYKAMLGDDWEDIVDSDTKAVVEHSKKIGNFFHKPLCIFTPPVMLTGSAEDEFIPGISQIYTDILSEIGHGEMVIYEHGGHPAILSNQEAFVLRTKAFFNHV